MLWSEARFHRCEFRAPFTVSSIGLVLTKTLLTLAVPLAIVEPLKLVALFVVGGGHFIAGVLVMICAYAGSLFISERLFVVLKPKLLTLPWFAFAWRWFVTVRDKLVYWLRRTRTRVRKVDPHFS